METYEIKQGNKTTEILGDVVAEVSAELPGKERWTELRIFLTVDDIWVLQGVGRSIVPGEIDFNWAVWSSEPLDIIEALIRNGTISRLAKKLIADALFSLCICDEEELAV